jgi:hypothetical protein
LNPLVINSYSWNGRKCSWKTFQGGCESIVGSILTVMYTNSHNKDDALQHGWCSCKNALSSICTLAIFQCCAWTERALFMIIFVCFEEIWFITHKCTSCGYSIC